jgi:hypothetical protein
MALRGAQILQALVDRHLERPGRGPVRGLLLLAGRAIAERDPQGETEGADAGGQREASEEPVEEGGRAPGIDAGKGQPARQPAHPGEESAVQHRPAPQVGEDRHVEQGQDHGQPAEPPRDPARLLGRLGPALPPLLRERPPDQVADEHEQGEAEQGQDGRRHRAGQPDDPAHVVAVGDRPRHPQSRGQGEQEAHPEARPGE